MSMISADPPSWRPPRPATVTVAFGLQVGVGALLLGMTGAVVVRAVSVNGRISDAAARVPATAAEVSGARGDNLFGVLIVAGALLLAVFWVAVTALPLLLEASQFDWALDDPSDKPYFVGMGAATLLELILLVLIVILVGLPPSNRYFVRRPPPPPFPLGIV